MKKAIELTDLERDVTISLLEAVLNGWEGDDARQRAAQRVVDKLRRLTMSSFADIDAKRKRYDPRHEGYGSRDQWRGAFRACMGFEEAEREVHKGHRTPREILGLAQRCTWSDVRVAYRKKAMDCHPDRIAVTGLTREAAEEAFKRLTAAYTLLAREFGEKP
jgi:hypothetical protein